MPAAEDAPGSLVAQTECSDPSGLTAYVAVVEFGVPMAKVVRR
jgi:hypothetical protein